MVDTVLNALQDTLSDDQMKLLNAIYDPFQQSGEWPIWQYVDLALGAIGIDALAVISSLPRARNSNPAMWGSMYGLTAYVNMSSNSPPNPDNQIALTVAGLRYVESAKSLLESFLITLRYLVEEQRKLIPSPIAIVEAIVPSDAIREQLLSVSSLENSTLTLESILKKLRQLLQKEPILHVGVQPSPLSNTNWVVNVPVTIRELRGVTTINEYVDQIVRWIAPPFTHSLPESLESLDIPNAVGYLDAVWKSKTSKHLFLNLDPTSVARLTQPCASESDFNSLLSALSDVLGQVVTPGQSAPLQSGALEAFRDHLCQALETEASDRAREEIEFLIWIRHLRVSTQHGDARHKAVKAFDVLGLTFPPMNWQYAWILAASKARTALNALREEIKVGIPDQT